MMTGGTPKKPSVDSQAPSSLCRFPTRFVQAEEEDTPLQFKPQERLVDMVFPCEASGMFPVGLPLGGS